MAVKGLITRDKDGKIQKPEAAGRVLDVGALRHGFGTMLAKAGVLLQAAPKAMRHSAPALTANSCLIIPAGQAVAREKDGGPCRSRTCDLVIKSHLLYRLS